MGLLESLLGSPSPPERSAPGSTINLPEDEYTVAFPVAIHRSRLTAFTAVIEAERETPPLDGPMADQIIEEVDKAVNDVLPDDLAGEGHPEQIRSSAEEVIEWWQDTTSGDIDVVYVPVGAVFRLKRILFVCEQRAEIEEDPFTLPDEFPEAVALLSKLRRAEDRKEPVFVTHSQIPPLP